MGFLRRVGAQVFVAGQGRSPALRIEESFVSKSEHTEKVSIVPAGTPRDWLLPMALPTVGDIVTEKNQFDWSGDPMRPLVLQDTRDWYALHGGRANILFADGSVRHLVDTNKDGYINPGFPIPSGSDTTRTGYADGRCEINPWECFTGTFLSEQTFRNKLYE